jgi:hypothetical protein
MAKAKTTKATATSTDSFAQSATNLIALAKQMLAELNMMGLASLTVEERAHSNGKLREGEADAVSTVFDAVDAVPGVFASLADKDGGSDPEVVETAPARAALARSQQLAPFVALIETIGQRASDDVLASASTAKALSIPAYAIGRTNASLNKPLRTAIAPAISFYGAPALLRTTRATRAVNAAKKAAKKSKGGN